MPYLFKQPRLSLLISLLWSATTQSADFALTEGQDLIGEVTTTQSRYEDTLIDIAEQHGLGLTELRQANPDVDVWLPGENTPVVLPSAHLLPSVREGLVINLAEYRMYYFHPDQTAVSTYPIGIGRDQSPTPRLKTQVVLKIENPSWYPSEAQRAAAVSQGSFLPAHVPPGLDNPLGKYAIKLAEPGYFIHGTNRQFGIGLKISAGCIRMYNPDIDRLVWQVPKGETVHLIHEPVKMAMHENKLYLELHPETEASATDWLIKIEPLLAQWLKQEPALSLDSAAIRDVLIRKDGIPSEIGTIPEAQLPPGTLVEGSKPADDPGTGKNGQI